MAGGVAGQVPDTAAQRPDSIAEDTVPAPVEPLRLAGTVVVSGGVGTAGFGTLQRQQVDAIRLDAQGGAVETRRYERVLAGAAGYAFPVAATLWLSERWGARLDAFAGRSDVEVGYPVSGWEYMEDAGTVESRSGGSFSFQAASAALLFRLPLVHPLYTPYALVAAGVMEYAPGSGTPAAGLASVAAAGAVFTGAYGLGTYVPLGDRLLLQLEATRRTAPTPVGIHGTGTVVEGDSLRVVFVDPADVTGDPTVDTVAGWTLTVGVAYRIRFRRARSPGGDG